MVDRVDIELFEADACFDIAYDSSGDIETTFGFDTAILMSILSQRRATEDEVELPQLRRGWIGNLDNDFPIGSKIWLFDQARRTQSTLNGVQEAGQKGVDWFLDDALVNEIEVLTEYTVDGVLLIVKLIIENKPTEMRYFSLWQYTGT